MLSIGRPLDTSHDQTQQSLQFGGKGEVAHRVQRKKFHAKQGSIDPSPYHPDDYTKNQL